MLPPDLKDGHAVFGGHALQNVAGPAQKMRNIDNGERIGAFDGQPVALRQPAELTSKGQFRPRKSRSIEEHPNLIFGLAKGW